VLPQVLQGTPSAAVYVLAGYLAVHLAQHVFTPHFHFGEETHHLSPSAGWSALLGLTLHTFFDGVAIASGFLVSNSLGVLLFLAVLLHKLPEGVTIASVIVAGGQSRRQAVGGAAVLGGATILGVLLTDFLQPLAQHGLALSAGVTLYVAASNLVPEFQAKRGWLTALAFFGGAVGFFVTERLLAGWLQP
jgi:zinc and cadmium transporter